MKAVYPYVLDPAQPFDDGHHQSLGDGYADYRAAGGVLDPTAYAEQLGRLGEPLARERLLIDHPGRAEGHRPRTPPWVPTLEELVRIGTEVEPDLGGDAPDLVLGPWADEPLPRGTAAMAVAELSFSRFHGSDRTPARRWARQAPLHEATHRAAVNAVGRAPLSVWDIEVVRGSELRVVDRLGLNSCWVPTWLDVPRAALVEPASLRPGNTLIARAVFSGQGWRAPIAFLVSGRPPQGWLDEQVDREWVACKLRNRKLSREEILRKRGFVIARQVLSWAFWRNQPSAGESSF